VTGIDRRQFLSKTGTAAAFLTAAQYSRVLGANDRIAVAVVGTGGRGKSHVRGHAQSSEADVVAIVDIDQAHAEEGAALARKFQKVSPKEYQDQREMLEDKSIDAVSIATPNHWHALSTIWACQAGKDVYVEKPASHNVFEGRKMVEAARKYRRIVQVGQQSRSTPHKINGIEQLRNGLIGEVYMAKGLCYKRRKTIGSMSPSPVPPGIEYDIWLGPARPADFQENRFHYKWHWNWAYGNGDIGNQGVHQMDVARWGLGKDALPEHAVSMGGHYVYDDDQQTPNTQQAIFDYGDSQLGFEVRGIHTGGECGLLEKSGGGSNTVGVLFFGSEGYLTMAGNGYWSYLGEKREPGPSEESPDAQDTTAMHIANFLAAVKSRKVEDLTCDILEGHISAAMCHLANISYRTGDKLLFDPENERFHGNPAANEMLTRDYRPPFVVPDEV